MYLVTVYKKGTEECVDTRNFEFGNWKEIGFWLDYNFYNDDRFYVKIFFMGVK